MGRISTVSRRRLVQTAALGAVTAAVPLRYGRSQARPSLKLGVLLPRTGILASQGTQCVRGYELAVAIAAEQGVTLEIMLADTESNVDTARARAERLVGEGAQMLSGAFDSGQTLAIAQVAEQRSIPFVINIAAAPQITDQGFKYVFRNFPKAGALITNGLTLMKDLFAATNTTPRTAVLMHSNDTFGLAQKQAIDALFPRLSMPFTFADSISYDPRARDLSVEVSKARAARPDLMVVVTRANDAILIVREMVRQRFDVMGLVSPGSPGMYDSQFVSTLGRFAEFAISNVPWVNPNTALAKQVAAAFAQRYPQENYDGNLFNMAFSLQAALVGVDAVRRAGSTAGPALAEALRATRIENHMMIGGPITFDATGQNDAIPSAAIQVREGRQRVILPAAAADAQPVFPVPGWTQRG
ncbi:MAG: branched-chain amino acid ABC transporter [Alphaproteobacteria bacterium]|nr:ABC transporter substrate-binding protein [Alphaproteobacteria bacterium]TAD91410.1 MAG: branched-chain amino acid ABC transporter [Alphaproteobacteria bacterium]